MNWMREYIATIKRILDMYAVFPIQKCDEEEVDLKADNVSLLEFIGAKHFRQSRSMQEYKNLKSYI